MRLLAVLALAFAAAPAQEPPAGRPRVELPPGPAAESWARCGEGVEPAALAAGDAPPAAEDDAWATPAPWLAWAAALKSAAAPGGAPRPRAWLALLALQQDRSEEAWDHFAAAAAQPGLAAALLPAFLPGVPRALLLDGDAALPDGVLLRPALPPADGPAWELARGIGRLAPRAMRVAGVRVGEATLALRVALESDGVQVELAHLAGGPARVRVSLPEPLDFELRVVYLDWERLDDARAPVEVALAPGGEPRIVFGRLLPRDRPWPTLLPPSPTARLAQPGLLVLAAPRCEGRIEGLARGLAAALGLPAEARALPAGAPPPPWPGITVDLRDTDARKLAAQVGLAERFLLRGAAGR